MSIICNTDFDNLSENNVLESIDNVPDSIVIILDSDIFEPIIENNDFTSNRCDESDNFYYIASLDEYLK